MAFLKSDQSQEALDAQRKAPARELTVDGLAYSNSAAKFWVALLDEVAEEFPACDALALTAPSSEQLSREQLDPSNAFARSVEEILATGRDPLEVLEETIEELTMFGPPDPVRLRLWDGETVLYDDELSTECLDEEILSCMLVWLLEWSKLSEDIWNQEFVHGAFVGEDKKRERRYAISFELTNEHLSEGLFRRTCRVSFAPSAQI